jgi:multiple sugar transport system permease protein
MQAVKNTQPGSRRPGKGRRSKAEKREMLVGYLFLLPNVIGFIVFTAGPVLASLGISLVEWNIVKPAEWVGLRNYITLAGDADFWNSLRATLYYMVATVPTGILLSFVLALLLNQKIRWVSFYRTVYFIPVVTSMVAVALMWRWIYNPVSGILNYNLMLLFDFLHLDIAPPDWLQSTTWAMPAIAIMSVWKGLGYNMVIYLAALQGVPRSLYEAAEIDGARAWDRLVNVTIPLVSPTTFFVLIMAIIGSFQVFVQAYVMTQGGPARSTVTTVYYVYDNGFRWFKMGYASAVAWVLFALVMAVSLLQWKFQRRWVFYE